MRRLSIYLATAAVTLTAIGAAPATAYAAVNVCNTSGRKVTTVVGNVGKLDCNQLINIWKESCQNGGNGFVGSLPGINLPGNNQPDNDFQAPDFSIPNLPSIPDNTPDVPEDGGEQDSFVQQVVQLVNEERAKVGLAPLTVDTKAANAAQVRAGELTQSFSHTRPDGSSFSTALTQAGASFKGAGENIAYGQTTPEQAMESWMNSSGHRANILSSSYTSIGVGHYRSASGTDYWTQLFIQ